MGVSTELLFLCMGEGGLQNSVSLYGGFSRAAVSLYRSFSRAAVPFYKGFLQSCSFVREREVSRAAVRLHGGFSRAAVPFHNHNSQQRLLPYK